MALVVGEEKWLKNWIFFTDTNNYISLFSNTINVTKFMQISPLKATIKIVDAEPKSEF